MSSIDDSATRSTRDRIPASPSAAARDPRPAAAKPRPPQRGYGWLLIMLLIAAMFGTPVVIAAMILLRG